MDKTLVSDLKSFEHLSEEYDVFDKVEAYRNVFEKYRKTNKTFKHRVFHLLTTTALS